MIRYNINPDNTIQPSGELDPEVFSDGFQKRLDEGIMKNEQFVKWCQLIFKENLSKRSENRIFEGSFGAWFVHKIGQKGVKISEILSNVFESEYAARKIKSGKAFLALKDFLRLDWNNVERQFIEDRFIDKFIDENKKSVKKIVMKARRIKNKNKDIIDIKESMK
jgi:hypothetical protein